MSRETKSKKGGGIGALIVLLLAVALILNRFGFFDELGPDTSGKTDPKEQFDDLPEELYDNLFVQSRAAGGCYKLQGDVHITVIFADDILSRWDDEAIKTAKASYDEAIEFLTDAAKEHDRELDVSFSYETVTVSEFVQLNNNTPFTEAVLEEADLPEIPSLNDTLEEELDVDEAPVIICLNRAGRSFTSQSSGNYGEYVILYNDGNAFAHEFLHLFGAEDFYYPEEVQKIADELFPDSIMMSSSSTVVDSLTAYLIGWEDEPSKDAIKFLEKTVDITAEQLKEEHAKETYTGYVTDHKDADGTYTGDMVEGVFHGTGSYTWANGDNYSGEWINGSRSGYGTYTWANGDTYVGYWVDSQRVGEGTFTWADGTVYEGDWQNGKRTGTGTMTFTNGNTYVGAYVDGKRNGRGTFTWTDGTVYVGDWVDDVKQGNGTMTWKNGDKYTGAFKNDLRHGTGTYTWANGDKYVGSWQNGKKHGQGTLTWKSGTIRSGTWNNDTFMG